MVDLVPLALKGPDEGVGLRGIGFGHQDPPGGGGLRGDGRGGRCRGVRAGRGPEKLSGGEGGSGGEGRRYVGTGRQI
ncbi:hypothetical protein GCM10020221_10830 [Streptomyces thioluteus]|uniref:Uncharacterized protein n=1 Tax=Streptomyces thioluteus TaxID=66431 RepID=A0ABN3WJ38_STRTU